MGALIGLVLLLNVWSGPEMMAQVKPQERGNCFQWPNCRGDSIGAAWIDDPDACKIMGGKSWMAPDRKCYNLPGGPHHIQGP